MNINSLQREEDDHIEYIGKTGKKRERATQACTPCRKKKKRCDGTKPHCRNCQEADIECAYAACKRRGPRKGYVQLLEERLAQLEKKVPGTSTPVSNRNHHGLLKPKIEKPLTNHHININIMNEELVDDIELPPQDIVIHLVDYFFKYINSVFPLLHHPTLMQSIKDGTVSQPLLWSVMAIGARFSDHPEIKTDPPYWAGEKFARKAGSLISVELFEPTVSNLQFWGVMACLEYGRAAGSRAWIYGGLASRLCFELGFHKKETEQKRIEKADGTLDKVAMLMRRRIFWSCFNIDKFGSAGNSRPQFYNKGDFDVSLPDDEALNMLNPRYQSLTIANEELNSDSLPSFIDRYLILMEIFGDVIKGLQDAMNNHGKPAWPPMDNFDKLNDELQEWHNNLPESFKFTPQNLEHHLTHANRGKVNYYISGHIIWRTLVLALHKGSLAYVDQKNSIQIASHFSQETWKRILFSVNMCKTVVNDVMPIFQALKDICGINVIPYMGYSSYMFATILMTTTFTKTEEEHRKGSKGLALLYEMIECLRPYWPVCERLAVATHDLIVSHNRMYEYSQDEYFKRIKYEASSTPPPQMPQIPTYSPEMSEANLNASTMPSSMTNILNSDNTSPRSQFLDQSKSSSTSTTTSATSAGYPTPVSYSSQQLSSLSISPPQQHQHQQQQQNQQQFQPQQNQQQQQLQQQQQQQQFQQQNQQQQQQQHQQHQQRQHHHQQNQQQQQQQSHISTSSVLSTTSTSSAENTTAAIGISYPSYMTSTGVIDFNSSAFLYDTGIFGQMMFDESKLSFNGNNNNSNSNSNNSMFGFNDVQPIIYHPTMTTNAQPLSSPPINNNNSSNGIPANTTGLPYMTKRAWNESWQP